MTVDPAPRVRFCTATTLNGFLADDDDSLEWLFAVPGSESTGDGFAEFMATVGVLVMGSTTYRWVVAHEGLREHPQRWRELHGDRPTFVFSSRADLLGLPGVDIRIVSGPVATHWPAIEAAADGADVWVVGGGDLAGQFDDSGHLDELIISVAPATLRSGRPLLPRRIGSDRLLLTSVAQVGQFAELSYQVRPRLGDPPAPPGG
jgi:dihydrofolate reductase